MFYGASYLDKREFAEANTAFRISNGHFTIMLNPSSPTEDVVYTRGDFVPHIVISVPTKDTALIKSSRHRYITVPTSENVGGGKATS